MSNWRKFKLWLAWKLLGEPEEVNREVEYVYSEIYPKHDSFEKQTKNLLKEAFLRWVVQAKRIK